MLTDRQIQDAAFTVLRRWNDDRAWDRYTRESGPYDVTSLRVEVLEMIRAVLKVAALEMARGVNKAAPSDAVPYKPANVEVALSICREANLEARLPAPMCWDLALYVQRLESIPS